MSILSARLAPGVTLQLRPTGEIGVLVDGYAVALGTFAAVTADRALDLKHGVPLEALETGRRASDRELTRLVKGLAAQSLLEYRGGSGMHDQFVVEPQTADYWPRAPRLGRNDILVLSRFAYLRRRDDAMVLEAPTSGALLRIHDHAIASALATLAVPRAVRDIVPSGNDPLSELLALLVECGILLRSGARATLRPEEGDLTLWDFHDLLFHARSTEGRQAAPLGGLYLHADTVPPPPAVRPSWPGRKISLGKAGGSRAQAPSPFAELLHERHSTRVFDDQRPITRTDLAAFLDTAARVLSRWSHRVEVGRARPLVTHTVRPYPSAGASYELELYVAVDRCRGLGRGFYHYDAGVHALVPIAVAAGDLDAMLTGAALAMDAPAVPQVLITIAARFGRVAWKYSGIAYALTLKDAGVLTQTLYLTATDMHLGGCAIGIADIALFARMTGLAFHVEGPVGQFALGRAAPAGYGD